MGLFLAMSAVLRRDSEAVLTSLQRFAAARGGALELGRTPADAYQSLVTLTSAQHTTVRYPDDFFDWDDAALHLSTELATPVFSLHIHDSDLWMYLLFDRGALVDRFNPIPDYWFENEDPSPWQGSPSVVASLTSVSPELIDRYLIRWPDEVYDTTTKAYPTDDFAYADEWQLLDFMRRLGLPSPVDPTGEFHGAVHTFQCETSV